MLSLGKLTCALSLAIAFVVGSPADAQPSATSVPSAKPEAGLAAEYVVGPEDVIEIEVVGQPDRTRARVYTDGTVQLNLIGKIAASGKTTRQLGLDIAAALKAGGFYANPTINVEVATFSSRYVTVLGAVGAPGLVPINRPYRMSEIMARVGGVQDRAADFLIVRSENGAENRYSIDKLATGDMSQDPLVQPGDKIFFPVAEIFYISGQVHSPGSYPIRSGMTMRQAIGRAGGLTDSGTDRRMGVNRTGKKMKLDADAKVEPNDVIVVGERLF